ncbi:heparan-alpha-glucosaminide N-acetyltransferase domain-containing protein [Ascidiimonas sp. W6]|uniref:heparan-alpha-glucosaminide N-acetyltransferase domain-containing protein n=1 Tax=Ascidiimonas meishanensis TaxID=3128903 RepID=UPI0030EC82C6
MMKAETKRLYFIDVMRAWAILMMLQGHFIDGLLDPIYRDANNIVFATWEFFRGITAPTFFTVSGFIFLYLLLREKEKGSHEVNQRINKGVKRGLMLIGIGYLLRMNLFGLLTGQVYASFFMVDVLHCIGLSILFIIAIFSYSQQKRAYVLPALLGLSAFLIFMLEPAYKTLSYSFLPDLFANYFTKANGSVFTIFPWFGYAAFGGFMAILFHRYNKVKHMYPKAILLCLLFGIVLTFFSSAFFLSLFEKTQIQLFADIFNNNYLFIRLGNVLILFALFMAVRNLITSKLTLEIGKSTLYIYVIHFMILYGSFTGLGLYKYFHHSLSPVIIVIGAIIFMIVTTYLSILYGRNKVLINAHLNQRITVALNYSKFSLREASHTFIRLYKKVKEYMISSKS